MNGSTRSCGRARHNRTTPKSFTSIRTLLEILLRTAVSPLLHLSSLRLALPLIIRPGQIVIIRHHNHILILRHPHHRLGHILMRPITDPKINQTGPLVLHNLIHRVAQRIQRLLPSLLILAPQLKERLPPCIERRLRQRRRGIDQQPRHSEALRNDVVPRDAAQPASRPSSRLVAVDDVLARETHAPDRIVDDDSQHAQAEPPVRVQLRDVEPRAPVALDVQHQLRPVGHGGAQRVAPPVAQKAQVPRRVHGQCGARLWEVLQRPAAGLAAVNTDDGVGGEVVVELLDRVVRVQMAILRVDFGLGLIVWRAEGLQTQCGAQPGLLCFELRRVAAEHPV